MRHGVVVEDRGERCAIAVMAKTPQAGRSKTRLCPPLSFEEAARCSGAFLRDMTASIAAAGREAPIDGFAAFAPLGSEAGLLPHLAPGTRRLLADGGGGDAPGVVGFGRVLLGTVRSLLAAGYGSVCVLNSDSPTLAPSVLVAAAVALADGQAGAVMGAATDGGYYLLGLRHAEAMMFADIDWSTGAVAAQTRVQAARAGLNMLALPDWYDVDDAAGLRLLLDDLRRPELAARCPATQAVMDGLDFGRLGVAVEGAGG